MNVIVLERFCVMDVIYDDDIVVGVEGLDGNNEK